MRVDHLTEGQGILLKMFLSFLLIPLPHTVAAFSLASTVQHGQGRDLERDLGLEQRDADAIFSHTQSLSSILLQPSRPDCFRRARARCGGGEGEADTEDHVGAAIAMTLCELATARHHTPPMECAPFAFVEDDATERQDDDIDWQDVERARATNSQRESQSACVGALAHSAQFWSSYSGYLREMPQLCHAYGRWNDIDLARAIYANATREKVALIRFLRVREEQMDALLREHEAREFARYEARELAWEAAEGKREEERAEREMALENARLQGVSEIATLVQEMRAVEFGVGEMLAHLQAQTEDMLTQMAGRAGNAMDAQLERVGGLYTARFLQEQERSTAIGAQLRSQWGALSAEFGLMHQSVHALAHTAAGLGDTLANSSILSATLADSLARVHAASTTGWAEWLVRNIWRVDPGLSITSTLKVCIWIGQMFFSSIGSIIVIFMSFRRSWHRSPPPKSAPAPPVYLPPPPPYTATAPLPSRPRRRPPRVAVACVPGGAWL